MQWRFIFYSYHSLVICSRSLEIQAPQCQVCTVTKDERRAQDWHSGRLHHLCSHISGQDCSPDQLNCKVGVGGRCMWALIPHNLTRETSRKRGEKRRCLRLIIVIKSHPTHKREKHLGGSSFISPCILSPTTGVNSIVTL